VTHTSLQMTRFPKGVSFGSDDPLGYCPSLELGNVHVSDLVVRRNLESFRKCRRYPSRNAIRVTWQNFRKNKC